MLKWIKDVKSGKNKDLNYDEQGAIRMEKRINILNKEELRREIIEEAYCSAYTMYSGSTKIYQDLKENYWYKGIKTNIAEYVSKYLICQ